ncbi:MAG: DUF2203 family protein [Pseudomonadota bacterium]
MHEMRMYYNLAEANELVPSLDYLFSELARIQRRINSLCEKATKAGVMISPNAVLGISPSESAGIPSTTNTLRALSEEYMTHLDEIAKLGVVICDVDQGIVGFYSWFAGQEIFLSWQYGEPEVRYWHAVSELPETRRDLAELVPSHSTSIRLH